MEANERMCSHGYHSPRHLLQAMLFMLILGLVIGVSIGFGIAS